MAISNKIGSFFNYPQTDTNVTVWLQIDGKEYEVDQFKIAFSQPIDDKGEPQSETKGGQLMVTLSEALPESFYDWAVKSKKEKDGKVIFKIETGNAPLKVEFFHANCINFSRSVNSNGGLMTNLIISSEKLFINGIEHDNFWVR